MSSKHSFLLRVALLTREAAPVTTVVRPGDLKEAGLIIVKPGNYRELTRHRDFTRQSRKLLGPKPRPHGRRPPHDLRAIDSRGRGGGAVAARARANRPDRRRARGLCQVRERPGIGFSLSSRRIRDPSDWLGYGPLNDSNQRADSGGVGGAWIVATPSFMSLAQPLKKRTKRKTRAIFITR